MIHITEHQVRQHLRMPQAIELMRQAFEELATHGAINHPRRRVILPTGSVLHYMAAGGPKYFGAKIYASNPRHGVNFLFLLYRSEDAAPLATIEANALGQIRTGAASGFATDLLARPDSAVLGVIGSGFQAETQVAAMRAVRDIHEVRVWSRNAEKREKFADAIGGTVAKSARAAVENADIVVTATGAKDPVFEDVWISPGTHINAMGSNWAGKRELPGAVFARAAVVAVDSIEQARMESGDILLAEQELSWNGAGLVELKDVVSGRTQGRTHPNQITIFKSNGLAIEDVAAAGYVYEQVAR